MQILEDLDKMDYKKPTSAKTIIFTVIIIIVGLVYLFYSYIEKLMGLLWHHLNQDKK